MGHVLQLIVTPGAGGTTKFFGGTLPQDVIMVMSQAHQMGIGRQLCPPLERTGGVLHMEQLKKGVPDAERLVHGAMIILCQASPTDTGMRTSPGCCPVCIILRLMIAAGYCACRGRLMWRTPCSSLLMFSVVLLSRVEAHGSQICLIGLQMAMRLLCVCGSKDTNG
jgi:hypothetical protein